MQKTTKFKRAIARADGYNTVCPYKACGYLISLDGARKDEIIKCPNCRKEFKISKVV